MNNLLTEKQENRYLELGNRYMEYWESVEAIPSYLMIGEQFHFTNDEAIITGVTFYIADRDGNDVGAGKNEFYKL